MKPSTLLIALSVAFMSQQGAAATPTDFMGITLGQPFDMQECAYEQRAVFKSYSLTTQPITPCWQHYDLDRDPGDTLDKTGSFKINFRVDGSTIPDGIAPGYLSLVVVDGSVEGIYAGTTGYKSQSSVAERLTDKYGKPTKTSSDSVQNLAGARLSNITAEWVLPNKTQIMFLGMVSSIDRGYISVLSAKGTEYIARKMQQDKAKSPSF